MKNISYKNKVATVYLLTFFINLVNMFIATIAFPTIGKALHASFEELSWVANIYSLALALVIPISAWLSDKYGLKKIFLLSVLGSLISIIFCGTATSIFQLLFWRFWQGVSGGLLIPVGQTMVYKEFPVNERAKLSMLILSIASIAPAISPTIGGIIVDTLNWRWVFFINVPILALILYLAYAWLHESYALKTSKFDFKGMCLISSALILVIYGLSSFKSITNILQSGIYVVIGLLIMSIFYMHSIKHKSPILDLEVIKNRLFSSGMIFYIFISGVFTGLSVLNIFLFQSVLGISAAKTGILMLPFSLGAFLGIVIAGRLFNIIGPKPIGIVVLTIWILGLTILTFLSNKEQYNLALIAYFLLGIGSGTISYIAQTISMLNTKDDDLSKASAIWNLNRQLSFTLGVAIFTMIFQLLLNAFGIHLNGNFSFSLNLIKVFHYCFIIASVITIFPLVTVLYLNNKFILSLLGSKTYR